MVGLLSAGIFGYTNPRTLEYAQALGMAFQLTNIIRDVGEDARKDRIYLPLDELARFGVSRRRHPEPPRDRRLLAPDGVPDRARGVALREALAPAAGRGPPRAAAGLVMAAIYRTLLDEIRRDGYRVLEHRVALTPLRKLWIAWKTWITA